MKTLVTVYWVVEADMIGLRLKAQGIPFFAKDLCTSSALPSMCIGGIDIQVSDEDYERAQAVLAEDPLPDDIGDAWRNGTDAEIQHDSVEAPLPDGMGTTARKRPSWAKRIVINLAIIYVGATLVGGYMINSMMFHPHAPTYSWDDPHVVNIGTAADPIAAMWLPNAETNKVFLYSHGNAEDIGDLAGVLQGFQRAGFSVLCYDYPGYGLSAGKPTEKSVYASAETAYCFLTERRKIAPSDIIVLGRSIGSGPACYLAEKFPVGGLVVEAGFTSAPRVLTRIRILPFDPFPNIRRIPNIDCPVLFIHGTADDVVPFSHGKALFEAAYKPKEHLWVEGAGHDDLMLVLGDDYFKALDRFATQAQKESR